MSGKPERIIRAATMAILRTEHGIHSAILSLPAPNRHHHIHRTLMWKGIMRGHQGELLNEIQGFITTEWAFVDRAMGLEIAQREGQIIKKHGQDYELYSEDVWESGDPEAWIIIDGILDEEVFMRTNEWVCARSLRYKGKVPIGLRRQD